jgi:hypothetical protein
MRKFVLSLTMLNLLIATSAFAGSCSIPAFIKKGVKITYEAEMMSKETTIVEIDEKACWVKGDNGYWINLNAIPLFHRVIPAGK